MKTRHIIGCMSGTSMDGIDAALVRMTGRGLAMKARFVSGASLSLGKLSTPLRRIADSKAHPAADHSALATRLGNTHVRVIHKLMRDRRESIDLIGVHGQTVYHKPPRSLQLMNPHPLARAFNVPVAFDFRGADLAAGGQGAPITPLADYILFRHPRETRTVLNLGGFANFTLLPAGGGIGKVQGGDICVCNQLLDAIARRCFNMKYDVGGKQALGGDLKTSRMAGGPLLKILESQRRRGASLGTGHEARKWLDRYAGKVNGHKLALTACIAIALQIEKKAYKTGRIVVAGGGVLNKALLFFLASVCTARIEKSDLLGIPLQYREAVCMAVLTALARDGVSITLPQVTGRDPSARCFPCWIEP